jgi:hypothetical protein
MMGIIALVLIVAVGGFLFYKCRSKGSCCCCGSTPENKSDEKKDEPKKPGCCS